MGWRDRAIKVDEDVSTAPGGWKTRVVPVEEGPSEGVSFGLGASEGATFGFGDEAAGLANALGLDPARGDFAENFAAQGVKYLTGKENPVDKYREARDFVRAKIEAAEQANPKTFMGGQLTGGTATALIPGVAPVRGAKLLQLMKMGALAGGAQGLGSSEADLTKGDVLGASEDTGKGASLGALTAGGIHGAQKVGRFALDKAGQVAEHLSGLPHWLARVARREGPAVFNSEGTEQSITNAVDDIQSQITSYRKGAGVALGKVKKSLGIQDTLRDQAEDIAKRGIHDWDPQGVVRQALGLMENVRPNGREILKTMVDTRQAIDDLVDFSRKGIKPIPGKTEAVLKNLRVALNKKIASVTEQPMKMSRSVSGIPTVEVPAGPVRKIGQELRMAEGNFAKAADTFDTLQPRLDTSQKVISTVKNDLQGGLRSINPDLEALGNVPGGPEAFNTARNEVARFLFKTTDGSGGGTLTLLAKTLGLTPDRAGRFLAASGKGLDDFIAAHPKAIQYFQTLAQTAGRGGQSLAVANFVLQQREPEYQQMVNDLTEGGQ